MRLEFVSLFVCHHSDFPYYRAKSVGFESPPLSASLVVHDHSNRSGRDELGRLPEIPAPFPRASLLRRASVKARVRWSSWVLECSLEMAKRK